MVQEINQKRHGNREALGTKWEKIEDVEFHAFSEEKIFETVASKHVHIKTQNNTRQTDDRCYLKNICLRINSIWKQGPTYKKKDRILIKDLISYNWK